MTYSVLVIDDEEDTGWQKILDGVRSEREDLEFSSFDHSVGRDVGLAALKEAEQRQLPVSIAVRRGRQLVFHSALTGTTAEHSDWLRRKENTTLEFEVPSLEFLARQRVARREPDWLDPREFAMAGGSVPILVSGIIAGTVTVSGIVGDVSGDHSLAMRAIRSVAGS